MDVYTDRMDEEAREDDRYARRLEQDRRDRVQDHTQFVIPARTEYEEAAKCWACGAPAGAPCAAYCLLEQAS